MILAIDQGTTGTTCLVVDEALRTLGRGYCEIAQHFPRPGWVEHDPEEIWASVESAAAAAVEDAGVPARELSAIGITNQRETTLVWERRSGRPVHRAIVWQDRRTAERCRELPAELIRERTGLVPDPYFSATKLEWSTPRPTCTSSSSATSRSPAPRPRRWSGHGRRVEARPIAGTLPRGATDEEDRRLADRAGQRLEGAGGARMLVDLGRNDLGRGRRVGLGPGQRADGGRALLARDAPGQTVSGTPERDSARWTSCGRRFPAGTLSGAPKSGRWRSSRSSSRRALLLRRRVGYLS